MIGLILSQYRIEDELGRGGMGIVYKATDTKLNRTVALKVLPPSALASEDDRARFFREAQAAAQLHHPNIATVFQIDEAVPLSGEGKMVEGHTEKRPFIAMEFVEGETLSDYVKKGPVKLQDAVNITAQVAEALKAAHAKDIVHRDIKSANVMLTGDGIAKVLDFGLAKTNQSTMLTRVGSTLGTVAYMSPEQARGQEVDGRTDLYALGTMLYEMVAGRLPFAGDYEQAVLYSILNEPPEPLTAVRTGVPMDLERVVAKLLSKEAEYRYQSAAGLLADLKSLDLTGSGHSRRSMASMPAAAASIRMAVFPIWGWVLVGGALLLGAAGAWIIKPAPVGELDTTVRSLTLELPGFNSVGFIDPSDDGSMLAFAGRDSMGRGGIHLLDAETGETSLLVEDGGGSPKFSRDGTTVVFWRNGEVLTVPAAGGTPVKIADRAGRVTSWRTDNSLLYTSQGGLWLSPADGSEARRVTTPDSSRIHFISVLPGDRLAIFCASYPGDSRERLEIVDLGTGERTPIGFGTRPRYLPTGHLLYGDAESAASGPLFVRPFDLDTREFRGPQKALYNNAPAWLYNFDRHGTLYHRLFLADETAVLERSIFAYPLDGGTPRAVVSAPGVEMPRLARSDDRIAMTVEDGDDYLMIYDPATDVKQRITFAGDEDHHAWSADGDRIMLERKGPLEIWSTRGSGLLETLPIENADDFDWSLDGHRVVYTVRGQVGLRQYNMKTATDTLLEPLEAYLPRYSPDRRYVAYELVTGQELATVVRSTDGNTVVRLSLDGRDSGEPKWAADARSIFVRTDVDIVRIPVDAANGFSQTGPGQVVFSPAGDFEFDVGRDDTIYYWSNGSSGAAGTSEAVRVSVVMNWFEQIKRLAPSTR